MIINIPTEVVSEPSKPLEPVPYYKKREFLTITELAAYARCPRKYFYSAGCGFQKADESLLRRNIASHFGVAIGNAIPAWLSTGDFDHAYKEFLRVWGDHAEDDKRNPTNARLILFNFAQSHPAPNRGLYSILEPPRGLVERQELKSSWEIPYAIEIPGLPIPLIGSIDYWAQFNHDRSKWVVECKTSGEMSDRFASGFKNNPQGLAYTLAARAFDPSVAGYCMELLGTAKNPKTPNLTVPHRVTDHQLDRLIIMVREMGNEILAREAAGVWTQRWTGCGTYPMFYQPGYFCEYDPLCSVPDWTSMAAYYKVQRHEPYIMPTVSGAKIIGLKEKNADE